VEIVKKEIRIVQQGYKINIPKKFAEKLGIKVGDSIIIKLNPWCIEIIPAEIKPKLEQKEALEPS
jgi:bifunctional DNA-binding transcriptional regulator/antitoxin component of YhaV-PrlF toxin-antitoxin module